MAFTANDVLALARAGYNSQQIALLSRAAGEQPKEEPAPQPTQQPTQQPAPQPAPQPAQQLAPQPEQKTEAGLHDIMQQLQQLTGAIQMNNQINSQQPQPETVDDILANVIEP